MSDKPKTNAAETREDRLKQALRANLRRRKTQARARRDDQGDAAENGPEED